jgi:hypothetical protein
MHVCAALRGEGKPLCDKECRPGPLSVILTDYILDLGLDVATVLDRPEKWLSRTTVMQHGNLH